MAFSIFNRRKTGVLTGTSDITAVASDVPDRAVEGSHAIKKLGLISVPMCAVLTSFILLSSRLF
jgi:hypothetical protein